MIHILTGVLGALWGIAGTAMLVTNAIMLATVKKIDGETMLGSVAIGAALLLGAALVLFQ